LKTVPAALTDIFAGNIKECLRKYTVKMWSQLERLGIGGFSWQRWQHFRWKTSWPPDQKPYYVRINYTHKLQSFVRLSVPDIIIIKGRNLVTGSYFM